jgi:hypothetical protein
MGSEYDLEDQEKLRALTLEQVWFSTYIYPLASVTVGSKKVDTKLQSVERN